MCFQYEKGILDICMKLLQLSPQHQADMGKDLQNRSYPVYISRVISAMVRICSHSLLSTCIHFFLRTEQRKRADPNAKLYSVT